MPNLLFNRYIQIFQPILISLHQVVILYFRPSFIHIYSQTLFKSLILLLPLPQSCILSLFHSFSLSSSLQTLLLSLFRPLVSNYLVPAPFTIFVFLSYQYSLSYRFNSTIEFRPTRKQLEVSIDYPVRAEGLEQFELRALDFFFEYRVRVRARIFESSLDNRIEIICSKLSYTFYFDRRNLL